MPAEHEDAQSGDETTHEVRRAIQGRTNSLDWVIRRFSPLLLVQARFRLGEIFDGSEEEQDVVSEAWLVTLPRLGELAPQKDRYTPVLLKFLAVTIRSIANNRIRKAIRRSRAQADGGSDYREPDELSARVRGVLTALGDSESARTIASAIDALDEESRAILVMRGIEGRSNAQIAAELGSKPNTISHRYRKIIESLRLQIPRAIFDDLDNES